jgi:hypothetical protein
MVSMTMSISPFARSVWEDVQKKHDVPVNAIGMRIDPGDAETLKLWKKLGIDRFVKSQDAHRGHAAVAPASVQVRPSAPMPPPTRPTATSAKDGPDGGEGPDYYYRGNKVSR